MTRFLGGRFYTPPPLEGKIATDTFITPSPAPVVYKISGPMGRGFLYTTGAEAENSAAKFSKESVPPLYKKRSSILSLLFGRGGGRPVAPYCAIPRDYLSDTPLLRAMGFLVSQHGQFGAIPPPPFLRVSPLESMRSGGAIPPPHKGYLSDTCAIPSENKANWCDTPSAILSPKGIARYGGVSRIGPLRVGAPNRRHFG